MTLLSVSGRNPARWFLLSMLALAGAAPTGAAASAPASPPPVPAEPYLSPLPQGTLYVLPTSELPTPGLDPTGDVNTGQGL